MAQQTEAEIAKIQAHAEQEIASAGKAARMALKRYSAELAMGLAEQKVRARMTPETEDALVQGFVRNLNRKSEMTLSAVATRYAKALADVTTASGAALRPEDALSQLRAFEAALPHPANCKTR